MMYLMNRIFDESLCVATVIVFNILVIEDDERNRRKKMVLLRHNVLPARIVRRREKLSCGENRRQRRKQKGRTKKEKRLKKKKSQTNEEEKNIGERKVYPFTVGKENKFGRLLSLRFSVLSAFCTPCNSIGRRLLRIRFIKLIAIYRSI